MSVRDEAAEFVADIMTSTDAYSFQFGPANSRGTGDSTLWFTTPYATDFATVGFHDFADQKFNEWTQRANGEWVQASQFPIYRFAVTRYVESFGLTGDLLLAAIDQLYKALKAEGRHRATAAGFGGAL